MMDVADSQAGVGQLSELAYYYPEPYWLAGEARCCELNSEIERDWFSCHLLPAAPALF